VLPQQFPTGDVVVSERDLAERLRKRTDVVVHALNLLLNEQKLQRVSLSGYWKLSPALLPTKPSFDTRVWYQPHDGNDDIACPGNPWPHERKRNGYCVKCN
jgi:hypothetical protein